MLFLAKNSLLFQYKSHFCGKFQTNGRNRAILVGSAPVRDSFASLDHVRGARSVSKQSHDVPVMLCGVGYWPFFSVRFEMVNESYFSQHAALMAPRL